MSQDDLDRLRRCARPVMFKTGNAATPFSIKGSSFFVGFKGMMFVITARHVVGNFEPQKLLFFPTENTKHPVRIEKWWHVRDSLDDPDSSDLFIARVDFGHLPKSVKSTARVINLVKEDKAWVADRFGSNFFLIGYPSEKNDADYEKGVANIGQAILSGRYEGPGAASGTHELRMDNPLKLDFDGLSGSPVYSLRSEIGVRTSKLYFCGLAIRGSAALSVIQFLDVETILLALEEAYRSEKGLPLAKQ